MRFRNMAALAIAAAWPPAVGFAQSGEAEFRVCQVSGAEYEGWREVRAQGFTFCVPANWKPMGRGRGGFDARKWRGEGGEVEWGTGEPARTVVVERRVVTASELTRIMAPAENQPIKVRIDERLADLWNRTHEGRHFTGVQFLNPAIYIIGTSYSATTATRQLVVYRTTRFTSAEP